MLSSSLGEISAAHARIMARDLDLAVVTKIEQEAGVLSIDEALLTVASDCATSVAGLWIVGTPVACAQLAGNTTFTPTSERRHRLRRRADLSDPGGHRRPVDRVRSDVV